MHYHNWRFVKPNTDGTYTCIDNKCNMVFNNKPYMLEHYKTIHLYPDLGRCNICNKKYSPRYLKRHMKNVHKTDMVLLTSLKCD